VSGMVILGGRSQGVANEYYKLKIDSAQKKSYFISQIKGNLK
jgi:hypothetical protein